MPIVLCSFCNKTYSLSVDFLVGNTWIEFFGIYGEQKRYTELANEKIELAQKLNLSSLKLFPSDLKKLDGVLEQTVNNSKNTEPAIKQKSQRHS